MIYNDQETTIQSYAIPKVKEEFFSFDILIDKVIVPTYSHSNRLTISLLDDSEETNGQIARE